ncbi:NFX1-type zinc finger-containing protein 1-like [Haliotis rufescens]|uniref:NFX1-type zinc finger-containing protein 1-like n=1 Tax=Haliotis rufescens TaxID=6454 RepID=UPI00201EDD2A|nr:NFX1-type zinc finger-containing protein 1-like [Haliotis rufescens]
MDRQETPKGSRLNDEYHHDGNGERDKVPQRYPKPFYHGEGGRSLRPCLETKSDTGRYPEIVEYEEEMKKRCGIDDNPSLEHKTNEVPSRVTSECQDGHSTQLTIGSKRSDATRNGDRKKRSDLSHSIALEVVEYKLPTDHKRRFPNETNNEKHEISQVWNSDHGTKACKLDTNLAADPVSPVQRAKTDGEAAAEYSGYFRNGNVSLQDLQHLRCQSSDNIARCTADAGSWFQTALDTENWTLDNTLLMTAILAKGCKSRTSAENVSKMLAALKESNFLKKIVPEMLTEMSDIECTMEEKTNLLKDLYIVLQYISSHFPSSVMLILGLDTRVKNIVQTMKLETKSGNEDLLQEMKAFSCIKEHILSKLNKEKERAQKQRKKIKPPDDFRTLSIYPKREDLNMRHIPFLRRNKKSGTYGDIDEYLDTQFRLLREDFIQPLREGIQEYWDSPKDPNIRKSINVYKDVIIQDVVWSLNEKILHKLSFKTEELKGIKWENTKRLTNDALVCLSSDNFLTFYNATVKQRNENELQQGNVTVYFEIDYSASFSLFKGGPYVMIETPAYFEAYRPVLEALKCVSDDMPFTKYILECEPCTRPPLYMKYCSAPIDFSMVVQRHAELDLQTSTSKTKATLKSDLNSDKNGKAEVVPEENGTGTDHDTWPIAEDLGLNDSQYKAFKAALTEEFSIIQGPPGTGKTYVGLKLVETLLSNLHLWHTDTDDKDVSEHDKTSPMLLMCYTNHALDQFMEGISRFIKPDDCNSIVRIGGQSKNDKIDKFNIRNRRFDLRRNRPLSDITSQLQMCKSDIRRCGWQINVLREGVIHEDVLRPFIKEHFYHLTKQFDARHCNSAILNWLGFGMLTKRNKWLRMKDAGVQSAQEYYTQNYQLLETENQIFALTMKDVSKANAESNSESDNGADKENIEALKKLSKKQKEVILKNMQGLLRLRRCMTPKEVQNVTYIWKLQRTDRWRLYWYWVQLLQDFLERKRLDELKDKLCKFKETVTEYENVKRKIDENILKKAMVVGMTTTGAAKNYELLKLVKPRIIIIEEAAEVLESHTVTSIHPGCEHLILIGDHQQLRPNPNVHTLAKRFNLDLSLFERMVNNGLRINCLTLQHRMRPCISRLMRHIYLRLDDHPKVSKYENMKGIAKNLFFINHSEHEGEKEDSMSHFNGFEVNYIVRLCKYLLLQGYQKSQITILSAYLGQVARIRKELPNPEFYDVTITPVDNYQGEENDIILLSLVRSNVEEKVGFLRIENRVCVALSRAKMGMYVIGNFDLLSRKSDLWRRIISDVNQMGELGPGLPLYCQNHSNNDGIVAIIPEDFNAAPDGGCMKKCDFRLNCGHVCRYSCHPLDREHSEYHCQKACLKTCTVGHTCPKPCFEECGKCIVVVPKVLPVCEHTQEGYCHVPPEDENCQTQCERTCERGHHCQKKCFERCGPCRVTVSKTLPECGHVQDSECHLDPRFGKCEHDCEKVCPEGHPCNKKCHERCGKCSVEVPKILPRCGHEELIKCSDDPRYAQCMTNCENILQCGHMCENLCGQRCRCKTYILKLLTCGHQKSILCEDKNVPNIQCKVKCNTILTCGHPCGGSCVECWGGRLHRQCKEEHKCMLVCGHMSDIKGTYTQPCSHRCPTLCDHGQCRNKCGEKCTECNKQCTWLCPHFRCDKRCNDNSRRCSRPCKRRLECRHLCPGLCGEKCPSKCKICNQGDFTFIRRPFSHKSRYVQLSDCSHMLDVTFLDKWMQPFFNKYGVVEIGYRSCPFCSTPIRNNPRYGKILKCIQADIVELSNAQQKQEQIFRQAIEAVPKTGSRHTGFPSVFERKRLRFRRPESDSWISAQIRLPLLDDVWNIEESLEQWDESSSNMHVVNQCSEDIKYLRKWISEERDYFSEQETSDAKKELKRQTLLLTLLRVLDDDNTINSQEENFDVPVTDTGAAADSQLTGAQRVTLESGIRLLQQTGPLIPRVSSGIEDLLETLCVPESDDQPLRLHVQNIVLPKPLVFGCWFKCRNRHIFFEGSTYEKPNLDEVKCPECMKEEPQAAQT